MVEALDDLRIIDLSWQGPGPYCTMMLADLGAEVIRVEQPAVAGRRADAAAAVEPLPWDDPKWAAYSPLDRNKKSITLNLRHENAREALYKLVKNSDILVESYRPGVTKRLELDYLTLKHVNPALIYCSISGYGQDGPYAQLAGHDINYISFAGILGLVGETGGRPIIPLSVIADYGAGGMQAAFGILAAVHARQRTGKGQYLDISLTDSTLSFMGLISAAYFESGVPPRRGEFLINGGVPHYNVYETKDGKYLSIGCLEPWLFRNLCQALGCEEFAAYQNTREKQPEIRRVFTESFKTRTRDEWFEFLKDKDVCVAKVYDVEEVYDDPQIQHRNMIVEVEHPLVGKVKQVGSPIKLSETPGRVRSAAPSQGEHTREVLEDLGYSAQEIDEMKVAGVI